jgi:hypothetical protein
MRSAHKPRPLGQVKRLVVSAKRLRDDHVDRINDPAGIRVGGESRRCIS